MSDSPSPTNLSPLVEADPYSLEVLLSKHPEKTDDKDLTAIVAELRAQRARWDQAEAEGKKRAPKAPKASPTKAKPIIDLKDIEL